MNRVKVSLLLMILSVFFVAPVVAEIPEGYHHVEEDGFLIAWRIIGSNIEFILEKDTTGWVAIGFEPTRVMKDADIIIGYVSGEEVVVEDQFAHRMTAHLPDTELRGTDNVTVLGGSETDGKTRINFRLRLDSGDSRDFVFRRGEEVDVIYAWGRDRADNTTTLHAGRGSVTITL